MNFICDRVGQVLSGYVCLMMWCVAMERSAILQTKIAALGRYRVIRIGAEKIIMVFVSSTALYPYVFLGSTSMQVLVGGS